MRNWGDEEAYKSPTCYKQLAVRRMPSCSYLYVVGVELVARQGVERAEVLAS
jgi:hypothetical protein